MVSDSTVQLTFENLPLVEFCCSISGEDSQLSAEVIKINHSFSTTYLCKVEFSS